MFPSFDGSNKWNRLMATPLEKAHKDPESMKARILTVARRIFGEYGFHGATTRMIAQEVGIDISTLHYHWGEKKDLYEAVILDINKDLGQKLIAVERIIHGRPLAERMAIAIDAMTDYLFAYPEISNIMLFRYIAKTRDEVDLKVPEFTADIARSMGLVKQQGTSATAGKQARKEEDSPLVDGDRAGSPERSGKGAGTPLVDGDGADRSGNSGHREDFPIQESSLSSPAAGGNAGEGAPKAGAAAGKDAAARPAPPPRAMLEVLAVMNAIHNFISGENFFRPMVNLEREEYIAQVKETLKFILIPAFVQREG